MNPTSSSIHLLPNPGSRSNLLFVISLFAFVTGATAACTAAGPEVAPPPPSLTLDAALARAVSTDPTLRLVEEQLAAADGQIEQAGLRPNPVIIGEFENMIGTGPFKGIDGLEVTLGLSQLIETAQKREKRTGLARQERWLVAWEREARLYELRSSVRQAYVAVLLEQQSIGLNEDFLELARASENETARMVDAARAPEVELSRARLAVHQREFALGQARRALERARSRLAAYWGETSEATFVAAGEIALEMSIPPISQLMSVLPQTAPLARLDAVEAQRKSAVELEEARARPDIEVFAGARYFREGNGGALVAGVAIPWPMFDRNQGNILSAQAQLRAVEHERARVRRGIFLQLSDAYRRLVAAHEEALAVESNLRPAAEQTLASTEDLYQRGQYTLLNVLESRQTLFEIRETYLDALRRSAEAQAKIEALTQSAQTPSQ